MAIATLATAQYNCTAASNSESTADFGCQHRNSDSEPDDYDSGEGDLGQIRDVHHKKNQRFRLGRREWRVSDLRVH